MSKGQVFVIKKPEWFCPICGHNKIKGNSAQCCEDGCEMWFECEKCGYDPHEICEKVETIWGWEDDLAAFALETYRDSHPAGRAIIHERFLTLTEKKDA